MIEGKLLGDGRELRKMQMIFDGGTPGVAFVLQDEEGKFLMVEEEVEEPPEPSVMRNQHEGEEMETLQQELEAVRIEDRELQQQLSREKDRFRDLWRTNCHCLGEYDVMLAQKDREIEQLKQRLAEVGHVSSSQDHHGAELLRSDSNPHEPVSDTVSHMGGLVQAMSHRPGRGRAPQVDPFTGEEPEIGLDDWLPSLKRAATWNG